jgi:outer membrane protein OmpA-like peptidoglycan-associated protein
MNTQLPRIITIALLFLVSSFYSCAQQEKLHTKKKKAISLYYEGINYYDKQDMAEAEKSFIEAISIDPGFLEAIQLLATVYEESRQYLKSIEYYKMIINLDPKFYPNNFYYLANLQIKSGLYEEAIINFEQFQQQKNVNVALQEYCVEHITMARFAIELKNNPVDFNPQNLGSSVNTEQGEYSMTLTADEELLYFTKLRPRDKYTSCATCPFEEDFYISRYINGKWSNALPLGHPINTHGNEGAACISPDGMFFIFTACNRDDGSGSCDLYISKRENGVWSTPENMGPVVNSPRWDSQPSIAPDGKTLYFTSSRENSNPDIYVTIMDESGTWGKPVNIGKPVNTPKKENSPFIHPDGKTLYFMSDGHPGMGGMDIYMCKKQADDHWSEPVNIGYPINTHNDEGFFIVSASGKTAYYATDQLNGFGHFDIYSFELPEEVRPEPVYYLKGTITDLETGIPVRAEFELYNIHTGELVVKSVSDAADGSFLVCLPTGAPYALSVNKKGYLFYSEHFEFNNESLQKEPLNKDIKLQPIVAGSIVVMRNIFFDFDSDKLKDESVIELQKLIELLYDNPTMHIEIRGHTDNVGNPQYNKVLSEKRALSVYNFLVNNGIKKERLSYKGYGDSTPVADNATEQGRALNRRTEFMVTKF